MKRILQYAISTTIILLSLNLAGCSDDPVPTENPTIGPEANAEYRTISFSLPQYWSLSEETHSDILIRLTSVENTTRHELSSEITKDSEKMHITITIARNERITDGKYLLQGILNGEPVGKNILTIFRNEALLQEEAMYDYTFDANKYDRIVDIEKDSTKVDGYIINSDEGFEWFLYCLSQDENHAIGQYFTLGRNITLPMQGDNNAGRGYAPQQFSGTFDGNNKTLSPLYHIGSGTPSIDYDSEIGLFSRLLNGATVKNFTLDNVSITNVHSNAGCIAGAVSGNVTIDNVKVNGNIIASPGYGDNIGGIIGGIETGSTVSLSGIDLNLSISNANKNIGGIVGSIESSTVTINEITTKKQMFSVNGSSAVGGIIGYMENSAFKLNNIKLEHNVSTEDKDVAVISSDKSSLGGAIGCATGITADSEIADTDIKCPISTTDIKGSSMDIGGIIGKLTVSSGTVTLKDCQVYGLVTGTTNVGGLVGGYTGTGILLLDGCGIGSPSSGAATGVYGNCCVGGLIGATANGNIGLNGTTDMSVNVLANDSTSARSIGGIIGEMRASSITLKGDGYKIETGANIRVNGYSETGGLVGKLSEGSFLYSNNSFDFNGKIPTADKFSSDFTGRVTGTSNTGGAVGLVENSTVAHVNITGTVIGYGNNTGGAFGKVDFADDIRLEDITVSGNGSTIGKGNNTGGIAGYIADKGRLQDCVNYRPVEGGNNTGGITGLMDYSAVNPYIRYCVNAGDVKGSGCFGGVVGKMKGGDESSDWVKIIYCANYGSITGNGTDYDNHGAGGIAGFCGDKQVRITNCANHGNVNVNGTFHGVGGIAGALGKDPSGVYQLDNIDLGYCANMGNISCSGKNTHLGGILGWQEEGEAGNGDTNSHLHDCYNKGIIGDSQSEDNGGILGYADHYASIRRCVNYGNCGSGNAIIGTRKTAAILHTENLYYLSGTGGDWNATDDFSSDEKGDQGTYSGFDFGSVWKIEGGEARLQDCPFQTIAKP